MLRAQRRCGHPQRRRTFVAPQSRAQRYASRRRAAMEVRTADEQVCHCASAAHVCAWYVLTGARGHVGRGFCAAHPEACAARQELRGSVRRESAQVRAAAPPQLRCAALRSRLRDGRDFLTGFHKRKKQRRKARRLVRRPCAEPPADFRRGSGSRAPAGAKSTAKPGRGAKAGARCNACTRVKAKGADGSCNSGATS